MNKPFGFSKAERIRKKYEFENLYHQGSCYNSSLYRVFYSLSNVFRLGIAIPKRLGNAVFRNHQKRILREFFRKEKVNFAAPLDLIFVLKRRPEKESQQKEIQRIFQWLSQSKSSSEKY
jgi:ribonuclease P protein component